MSSKHQNLFQKGTAAYSLKRYKESTLTRLIQDLSRLESRGLKDNECDKIKSALNEAVALASTVPSGSFLAVGFWEELEKFRDAYVAWNGISESDNNPPSLRSQAIRMLTQKRRNLWEPYRNKIKPITSREEKDAQLELLTEFDKEIMDDMHLAFKNATDSHPDLFPSLRKCLNQFEKLSNS